MAKRVEMGKDALGNMAPCGYGQVAWQNGIGIKQNLVVALGGQRVLFGGTVVTAQETRTLADSLGIDLGASADNALGIPLYG